MSHIEDSLEVQVNSREGKRLEGTNERFTYKFDFKSTDDFNRVCVLGATIPKSYYTIQSGKNTFTLRENGTDTTITVTAGCYTRTSFKTVIQNLLNAGTSQGWVYTVKIPNTLNAPDTGKYTYTITGGHNATFIFTDYVFEAMGFNRNSTNAFAGGIITSANVVKLQQEDCLFLRSSLIANGTGDILQVFYPSASDYGNITYQCPSPEFHSKKIAYNNTNSYSFVLTNEDGEVMDLNGLNMNFTLLFWKKDNISAIQKMKIIRDLEMDKKTNNNEDFQII